MYTCPLTSLHKIFITKKLICMGKHCDALHRVHIYSSEPFLVWIFACAVYPVSCRWTCLKIDRFWIWVKMCIFYKKLKQSELLIHLNLQNIFFGIGFSQIKKKCLKIVCICDMKTGRSVHIVFVVFFLSF